MDIQTILRIPAINTHISSKIIFRLVTRSMNTTRLVSHSFNLMSWHKSCLDGLLNKTFVQPLSSNRIFIRPDAVACTSTYYPMATIPVLCLASLITFSKFFSHYVQTSLSRCPVWNCKFCTRDVFIFHCCVTTSQSHFPGYTAVRCAILWGKWAIADHCMTED